MVKYYNFDILKNEEAIILKSKFVRRFPKKEEYLLRLVEELDLIIKKKFVNYLLQVVELLSLITDIPHIIRGSSGSSLVCYGLGITNIDPIKENICFARFLNVNRETMPDIDMDFPYNKREIVFDRLNKHWENRVGRISNHVYYKEKSAMRKAISESGHKGFISRKNCNPYCYDNTDEIIQKKKEILGTFRHYSLHCGGIIIYDNEIPDEERLESKTLNQIKLNKDDVDEKGYFKIDILSNRGLAQLCNCVDLITDYKITNMDEYFFTNSKFDTKITKLFEKGFNLGLTFSESPAMRKLLTVIRPKNINDLALCLALVRPAANEKKEVMDNVINNLSLDNFIIYDDDAIRYIQGLINCPEGKADEYRKAFSKYKWKKINYFKKIISNVFSKDDNEQIVEKLDSLRKYSFCKSHSMSYAKLVWSLAYQKINNPVEFWLSTLNHCHSMYRKWVHFREAKNAGIELTLGKKPWILKNNRDKHILISVNSKDKEKKKKTTKEGVQKISNYVVIDKNNKDDEDEESIYDKDDIKTMKYQFNMYGYWISSKFFDNMYVTIFPESYNKTSKTIKIKFRGLIATGRSILRDSGNVSCTFVTIGYDNGRFLDISIDKTYPWSHYDCLEGEGYLKHYYYSNRDTYQELGKTKDEELKKLLNNNALYVNCTRFKFNNL